MTDVQIAPVLLIGFNRPQFIEQVFSAIRKAQPPRLFVALDHPREGRQDDLQGWTACKKIVENVDWSCEVRYNYAEKNMGCRRRIETAISWVFEQVDRVIVLEDDCVPCNDFFRFCSELLEQYKDDNRVGMICGHDEHPCVADLPRNGASYYFDRFTSIWGWATWRRAWEMHDPELSYWPAMRDSGVLKDFFVEKSSVALWKIHFEGVYSKKVDTWDTGLFLTAIKNNWLSIHAYAKLVINIGSGSSSRTDNNVAIKKKSWIDRPYGTLTWPLVHPLTMVPSMMSEKYARDMHCGSRWQRLLRFLSRCKWKVFGVFGIQKGH